MNMNNINKSLKIPKG